MTGEKGEENGEPGWDPGDLTLEELSEGQAAARALEDMLALSSQTLLQAEVEDLYDEVRQLGRGRFGRVLLVTHRQKGTPMALKLLSKASTTRQGFLYEFCVGLTLGSHPGIVATYGIGLETKACYGFLSEPALHGDLIALIRPKRGLPEAAAQHCADQLSLALEHIHSQGLVYRDLKPENVLVFEAGCRRVKLTDFGHTRPRGTLLRLAGPPIPYTAPELCSPSRRPEGLPIQPSLDAWALGVLLFCLLTGYFPWDQPLPSEDPFYQDFLDWRGSGRACDRPAPWAGLSPVAERLLGVLLDPQPRDRGPVGSVRAFLGQPWKEKSGSPELARRGEKEEEDEEEEGAE
ncbi:serine/threonine-protein kinase SBK2 isoform X2 [Dromiciops gliroides]|nr:serine/threonine-protein kinase SBK2 isoform X2 [Dromiciops gliroides]XP_043846821.1 serine/threonine-protein kinase SBK2 isoform X2 [Dromiciops gliroides]XP_043846822.1 serine/threonine-protein kinase SBK2 isoform X2 [Dromiciops gliroides]XP_043846823.1 serine/threonine-protein kinase SBK2 isoform X2 [Dromiciops gliroides]